MKIAVIGAGAIGGLVAGYLKLKGQDVSLVGHPEAVNALEVKGLRISGVRGSFHIQVPAAERLDYAADLIILATKTQDIEVAVKNNLPFLGNATFLTTQNGIQADNFVARHLPREDIISSIVMFGATLLEPGSVVHNFEGDWILGRPFGPVDASIDKLAQVLNQAFPVKVSPDLKGMKYLKIFVNANNCIPAILGVSMQEAFADSSISRISIAIWREGMGIVRKSGISLVSLPDFPAERLIKLTSLPIQEAAGIFSGIMRSLSKEPLYGSILQSIRRGRATEIDYINGEFVNLAKANRLTAGLNQKLVEMVHEVERTNRFFSKEELLNNTKAWIN